MLVTNDIDTLTLISVDTFDVVTPADENTHHIWIYQDKHYFEFAVHACSDALVYLADHTPISGIIFTSGYQIFLGTEHNKQIIVKSYPQNETVAKASIDGILNCYAKRRFWISWFDNILRVGSGMLFSSELLQYDNMSIPIRIILPTATPIGGDAIWEFAKNAGTSHVYFCNIILYVLMYIVFVLFCIIVNIYYRLSLSHFLLNIYSTEAVLLFWACV